MERFPTPSLNALKAFETAARHLSIKEAAAELNVTNAAVSHQIGQLEESFGTPLFRRKYRGVELTDAGQRFFGQLNDGFEKIEHAVNVMSSQRGRSILSIDVPPSFSSQWLMTRLHRFAIDHPDTDIRVSTRMRQFKGAARGYRGDSQTILNWATESDIVIAFGTGNYPGMIVRKLMPLYLTALCAPNIARQLTTIDNVANHTLLHDERGALYESDSFWSMWLSAAGVTGVNDNEGPRFTHAALGIEAATAGHGIIVTTPVLASGAIRSGQLIAPFDVKVPLEGTYCVVSRPESHARHIVTDFYSWITKEAEGA